MLQDTKMRGDTVSLPLEYVNMDKVLVTRSVSERESRSLSLGKINIAGNSSGQGLILNWNEESWNKEELK